jgi:4-carboxymuconolactone decarboxylase
LDDWKLEPLFCTLPMSGPESQERFEKGIELMRRILGAEAAEFAVENHASETKSVAEEMLDWSVENAFGFLLQRPGLTMRDRAIAMVGADVASMKSRGAFRDHARLALLSGVTPNELYEICWLLFWYVGMPSTREAMEVVRETVAEFESETGGNE